MDSELQALKRRLAADPDDARAQFALEGVRDRLGLGWFDELRPPGISRDPFRRGVYRFQSRAMPRPIEMVYVHGLTRATPFFVGRFHVTRLDYRAFCHATNRQPPAAADFDEGHVARGENLDLHPVINVSVDDTRSYCRWAGVSLPSRPQWELACFGEGSSRYTCGRCSGLGTIVRTDEWPDDFPRPSPPRQIRCPSCGGTRVTRPQFPWGNDAINDARAITPRNAKYGYWLHGTAPIGALNARGGIEPARPESKSWCGAFDLVGNACQLVDGPEVTAVGGSYMTDTSRVVTPRAATRDVGFRILLPGPTAAPAPAA